MTYLTLQNLKSTRTSLRNPTECCDLPCDRLIHWPRYPDKLKIKPENVSKLLITCIPLLLMLHTSTAAETTPADNSEMDKVPSMISAVTANSLGDVFISIQSASVATQQTHSNDQSGKSGIAEASMSQVGTIHRALLDDTRLQYSNADQDSKSNAYLSGSSIIELSPDTAQLSVAASTDARSSMLFTGNSHASALRFMPLSSGSASSGQQANNLKKPDDKPSAYQGALYIAANEFAIWKQQDTDSTDSYAKENNAGLTNLHRLALDNIGGQWQINEEYSIELDLAPIDGLFNASELLTSPWETLLAVESMSVESTDIWNAPQQATAEHKLAHIRASAETVNKYLSRDSNPYRYGYVVELIDQPLRSENSEPVIQRHYATGRLPAGKTLISRDGQTLYRVAATSGILFRFISDFPNNLAAGTLSVGRFIPIQPDASNPYVFKAFNLEWIELGRGNNEEIAGWIADYEGMSAYDFSEEKTSYLSDDDIAAWFDKHKRRNLNDSGDIGQYIDSRVAFLEPIKAAAAIGADRQAIKVRDITQSDTHMVLKVAADNIGKCGELFTGAPDIEGNLSYIKRVEMGPELSETSLCGERFVRSQNERFLPMPGTVYMTDGFTISRTRLPLNEN